MRLSIDTCILNEGEDGDLRVTKTGDIYQRVWRCPRAGVWIRKETFNGLLIRLNFGQSERSLHAIELYYPNQDDLNADFRGRIASLQTAVIRSAKASLVMRVSTPLAYALGAPGDNESLPGELEEYQEAEATVIRALRSLIELSDRSESAHSA